MDTDYLIYGPGIPSDLFHIFASEVASFETARYNGHPDFAHLSEEVHAALSSSDTVAVVGVGNVALDCARVLAKGEMLFCCSWSLGALFIYCCVVNPRLCTPRTLQNSTICFLTRAIHPSRAVALT